MNNTRDIIMETLEQAGITTMSVDDVIANFQASDELAAYLVGEEDVEQAVLAHLPQFLALYGYTAEPDIASDEMDPTSVQSNSTNMPAMPTGVTSVQATAIASALNHSSAEKHLRSTKSSMIAVLIDKPYPGEWMGGIGKLHVKGDSEKVIAQMKERYMPDSDINSLLSRPDSHFIPSNDQLSQLKVLHQNTHVGTKTVPAWYDFDNETAYNSIMDVLTSGDGLFDVLIPPREDDGEGAYKNKAWRWATKGFVIRMPSTNAGEETMDERNVTKQAMRGLLTAELGGFIPSHKPNGLGCKMVTVKKKSAPGSSAQAVAEVSTLRVAGNNPSSAPETRPVHAIGNGEGKMAQRSSAFYFAVRVNKNGVWSVKKMRLPLLWEQAPVWVCKPEYETLFPTKVAGGIGIPDPKAMQDIQNAQIAFATEILSSGGAARLASGMDTFIREVEELVNESSARAAAEISL